MRPASAAVHFLLLAMAGREDRLRWKDSHPRMAWFPNTPCQAVSVPTVRAAADRSLILPVGFGTPVLPDERKLKALASIGLTTSESPEDYELTALGRRQLDPDEVRWCRAGRAATLLFWEERGLAITGQRPRLRPPTDDEIEQRAATLDEAEVERIFQARRELRRLAP
jgi:hypothetical protein